MRTIKVFLASSTELKSDRDEFEIFISRKNSDLIKKSIYIELVKWENYLDAMSVDGLQSEYNQAVKSCDIFVSLFFTKAGKYSIEEFKVAWEAFKNNGKPLIYTYFKGANINTANITKNEIISLLQFKEDIGNLGHYYTSYTNIDNLKLHFNNQLDKLANEGYEKIFGENIFKERREPTSKADLNSEMLPNPKVAEPISLIDDKKTDSGTDISIYQILLGILAILLIGYFLSNYGCERDSALGDYKFGLFGYFQFDHASINDDSTFWKHKGGIVGKILPSKDRFNVDSQAYRFYGDSTSRIEISSMESYLFGRNFTVSMWIKPDEIQNRNAILLDFSNLETFSGWAIQNRDLNNYFFTFGNGKTWSHETTKDQYISIDTTWNHLVITWDQLFGEVNYYLFTKKGFFKNRFYFGDNKIYFDYRYDYKLVIGGGKSFNSIGQEFKGVIDELRFYDSNLDINEVFQINELEKPKDW